MDKSDLAWVFAPTISEGHVVYRYRNAGTAAAKVHEDLTMLTPDDGQPGTQHFVLDGFAPDQEQETHAPFGWDQPDGEYVVLVNLLSIRDGEDDGDARIDAQVHATVFGGVLHPAGTVSHAEPQLWVSIDDFSLDGEHAMVRYTASGNVSPDYVNCWLTLTQGSDVHWEGGAQPPAAETGVVPVAVPVDLVQAGEGWRLSARVQVGDQQSHADTWTQVHLPLARTEHGVHATGAMSADLQDI